ncbi:MAG: 30S ribosomal protein S7 [Candidatus Omnitrophica bacterium]|nr:30S ribosomal protein S7 [Candidatus Omnitrophota bacterium]
MRRRRSPKRELIADPKYSNKLVSKMINMLQWDGKKAVAEKIVYDAFDILKEKTHKNPLEIFQKAVENIRPLLEVKSRRVGGATYQVPVDVRPDRGITLALRWVRDFARQKKGRSMQNKLADEIMDAYNKTGAVIKKREDTHKMAEANRAFSHYRW